VTGITNGGQTEATIGISDFLRVDMRVGRVVRVEPFPEARTAAVKLQIDFGALGSRRSSAQIAHYAPDALLGRLVIAVVNFPPRQIGPFMSEVLVLGVPDQAGRVTLLSPDEEAPPGGRVY
jgi:tRNA-binding protein